MTRDRSDPDFPRYVISIAAELAGIHPQTLRAYERVGLVRPARTAGGGRRYSDADLSRIDRIAELTRMGLPHVGIKLVLDLEDELGRMRADDDRASPPRAAPDEPSILRAADPPRRSRAAGGSPTHPTRRMASTTVRVSRRTPS